MKFIHTSDWHIGRQFHSVSLLEDQRHVLQQLIKYIEEESVDALVIAGDIYDRSIPPADAVALLDDVLHTICVELNVPVILISGNHDSAERLRFGARQLKRAGLHILGDINNVCEPVIIKKGKEAVAFYGIPYCDPETVRHTTDQAVSTYDDAHTLLVNRILASKRNEAQSVLISHCFMDGAKESDSERPLSIGGSDRVSYQPCVDFDYVALGHLHAPQFRGEEHIRYSGSLLKYSFSEQHQKKGVNLVELSDSGVSTTHLPLQPLLNVRVLEGELETIIQQGRVDPNSNDYLLVRLADKFAILDPMSKLREVYPNVLQLEKPGMLGSQEQPENREKLKRGELEMFRDFFQQVQGFDLSSEQEMAITETIAELHNEEV